MLYNTTRNKNVYSVQFRYKYGFVFDFLNFFIPIKKKNVEIS
jgi:hypothetical protein